VTKPKTKQPLVVDPHQLLKRYLVYIEKVENVAVSTYKNRKYILMAFFDTFGISDVRKLTIQMVDEHLIARGVDKKPATIQAERQILRSYFWFCQTYHDVEMQFDWSMVRRVAVPAPRIETFTAEEIAGVVSQCKVKQDGLMIATLYESGVRIGELVSLACDDVRGSEVQVRGKGEQDRVVFITSGLADALAGHMHEEYRSGKEYLFQPIQHHYNHPNFKYGKCAVRDRIKARFAEAGLEGMHPHQLRHSYAITALRAGMDVRTLQKLLGHRNIDTTMRYLQLTDRHIEENYHKYFRRSVYRG
jgi:site-specific recombinase XerD